MRKWIGASILGGCFLAAVAQVSFDDTTPEAMPDPSAPLPKRVEVVNLPAVQNVAGTVGVSNFPAVQPVSGTVAVSNLPSVQQVEVVNSSTEPDFAVVEVGGSIVSCAADPWTTTISDVIDVAGWSAFSYMIYFADGTTYPSAPSPPSGHAAAWRNGDPSLPFSGGTPFEQIRGTELRITGACNTAEKPEPLLYSFYLVR